MTHNDQIKNFHDISRHVKLEGERRVATQSTAFLTQGGSKKDNQFKGKGKTKYEKKDAKLAPNSNKIKAQREQVAVVLCYVNKKGKAIEKFLGVQHVTSTTSSSLEEAIERFFATTNLSISKLRGQGYDGASNMKGELNGLKTKILNKYPQAFYVHYFAHQLQLALVAVAKGIEGVVIFFNNASILVNTIGSSCKCRDAFREKQLEQNKKALDVGDLEMGRGLNQKSSLMCPCDTRWNSHYGTIVSIIVMFEAVVEVLE
nr:zinc finger MYM-type protein 1-like [Malus domestica]